MSRLVLPVILGFMLLGAAYLGSAQYAEAAKLRASLAALEKERADLRQRVWDLQKLNGELAARHDRGSAGTGAADTESPAEGSAPAGETPAGGRAARFDGNRLTNLFNSPEVQQLMGIQQKAGLDGSYAALFKKLNLSPAELEKFKSLLVEKQSALMDVMMAARTQGLTGRENREEIRQLVQDTQTEIDGNIRSALGETAYAQYKGYEATLPQRGVVNQLEQRLSYSSTPLSDVQAEQLVQILAANPAQASNGGNRGNSAALPFVQAITSNVRLGQASNLLGGASTRITDAAVTQAQTVLTPPQVASLRNLQQEQQAAAQLMQQMRGNRQEKPQGAGVVPPRGSGGG